MITLSERCRLTLESAAYLHRDDPEATLRPDILEGVACGKLFAHGLLDRVSDKPRLYKITPAGLAWLEAYAQRRDEPASVAVAPQLDLFGGAS